MELIRAADASHEAALLMALQTAGVPASVLSQGYRLGGASQGWSMIHVQEDDLARAKEAISGVTYTTPLDEPESPRIRTLRWTIAVAIGATVAYGLWQMLHG